MNIYMNRHSALIKSITMTLVCLFLVNNVVTAYPEECPQKSALAVPSQLTKDEFRKRFMTRASVLMHPAANEALQALIKSDKTIYGTNWDKGDNPRARPIDINDINIRGNINHRIAGLDKILLVKVNNLFRKTGQFAHVGLSGKGKDFDYGMPVIYVDALYYDRADKAALKHEIDEMVQWEELRSIIANAYGMNRSQINMREWIKANINKGDEKLTGTKYQGLTSLQISKRIHKTSHSLEGLYRLVDIGNGGKFFQYVDYDYIRELYDRDRYVEGQDVNIAAAPALGETGDGAMSVRMPDIASDLRDIEKGMPLWHLTSYSRYKAMLEQGKMRVPSETRIKDTGVPSGLPRRDPKCLYFASTIFAAFAGASVSPNTKGYDEESLDPYLVLLRVKIPNPARLKADVDARTDSVDESLRKLQTVAYQGNIPLGGNVELVAILSNSFAGHFDFFGLINEIPNRDLWDMVKGEEVHKSTADKVWNEIHRLRNELPELFDLKMSSGPVHRDGGYSFEYDRDNHRRSVSCAYVAYRKQPVMKIYEYDSNLSKPKDVIIYFQTNDRAVLRKALRIHLAGSVKIDKQNISFWRNLMAQVLNLLRSESSDLVNKAYGMHPEGELVPVMDKQSFFANPAHHEDKGSPAKFLETVRDNLLEQAMNEGGFAFKDAAVLRDYHPSTVYKEIQILISLGILERGRVNSKARYRFSSSIRALNATHAALLIDTVNNIEYKIGRKSNPLQRYEIPEEKDMQFVKELVRNAIDIEKTQYLSDILPAAPPDEGGYYTIRYNENKLSGLGLDAALSRRIFNAYVTLLRARLGGAERVELRTNNSTKQPIVSVECYNDVDRTGAPIGKGHVNIADGAFSEGSILRLINMADVAFAVSNIPLEPKRGEIDQYTRLISFIQDQYRELTGNDITLEEILRGDRIITLPVIKPIPFERLKEYYEFTVRQLEQAA